MVFLFQMESDQYSMKEILQLKCFTLDMQSLYYSIYLEIISIKCAIGKHETSMNCLPRLVQLWNTLHKNIRTWVWKDGSAVKNTYCSYRGPRFSSQHPHPIAIHTSKATRYARVPHARMQAEHSHTSNLNIIKSQLQKPRGSFSTASIQWPSPSSLQRSAMAVGVVQWPCGVKVRPAACC